MRIYLYPLKQKVIKDLVKEKFVDLNIKALHAGMNSVSCAEANC